MDNLFVSGSRVRRYTTEAGLIDRVFNMEQSVTTPVLQSLLLADHVYRDQMTGKHVICGVFSTIYFSLNVVNPEGGASPVVPAGGPGQPVGAGGHVGESSQSLGGDGRSTPSVNRPQPMQNLIQAGSPYVYFSVTEMTGRKVFEVRYVELHENRVLFQAEVPLECDDPLKTIEITLPLPRLPLVALEERSYALEVLCEGQLLGSHRVLARMAPIQPPLSPPPA